jgi:hypothetical protein
MVNALRGFLRLAFVAMAIFMAMISAFKLNNKTASADNACDVCLGAGKCPSGSTKCCDITVGETVTPCYKNC